MEEGRGRRRGRLVAVAVVAGLVGYMIGAPIVNAAANLVVIKDPRSARKAKVLKGGSLKVQPAGGFINTIRNPVNSVPFPTFGVDRFAEGRSHTIHRRVCDGDGILTEVVLKGATSDDYQVFLTANVDGVPGEELLWKGTVAPGEHLSDTFGSGVFWEDRLRVLTNIPIGQYYLYGYCFGSATFGSSLGRQ